jgi:hypothetical protein
LIHRDARFVFVSGKINQIRVCLRFELNARFATIATRQFIGGCFGAKQGLCDKIGEGPFADSIRANKKESARKPMVFQSIAEPLSLQLMSDKRFPLHGLPQLWKQNSGNGVYEIEFSRQSSGNTNQESQYQKSNYAASR